MVTMENRKNPTLVTVKGSGLKLDFVVRGGKVTGLSIDYQRMSNGSDPSGWVKMINNLFAGGAESPAEMISPAMEHLVGPPSKKKVPTLEHTPGHLPEGFEETNGYHEIVMKAVDKGLDFLGKEGKLVTLELLESRYGLTAEAIPEHPRGFIELLDEVLGSAAHVIEREIIREIRKVAAVKGETLHHVVHSLKESVSRGAGQSGIPEIGSVVSLQSTPTTVEPEAFVSKDVPTTPYAYNASFQGNHHSTPVEPTLANQNSSSEVDGLLLQLIQGDHDGAPGASNPVPNPKDEVV
jgi:hypothetical protein